jgi:hypothetical protein
MNRIYHPHDVLEEHKHGMWKTILGAERERLLAQAIEFTGNAQRYGTYMMRVVREWRYSCEHNLTCSDMNRQAWVGHAACCLALGCPEDITRCAWHCLTQQQQDEANAQADKAIQFFENNLLPVEEGLFCA